MSLKIVFATTNSGKFREASSKIREVMPECTIVQDRNSYPEIQADSFEEVAQTTLGLVRENFPEADVIMVDDSGLSIRHLSGFPGVYSSYVYRTIGCGGILKLLEGVEAEKRRAHFTCALAVSFRTSVFHGIHEGEPDISKKEEKENKKDRVKVFIGRCEGRIAFEESGDGGFGFDPIFIPEGREKTFAELPVEEKNALSHRGRAFAAFLEHLKNLSS